MDTHQITSLEFRLYRPTALTRGLRVAAMIEANPNKPFRGEVKPIADVLTGSGVHARGIPVLNSQESWERRHEEPTEELPSYERADGHKDQITTRGLDTIKYLRNRERNNPLFKSKATTDQICRMGQLLESVLLR